MGSNCDWPVHREEDITGVLSKQVWMPRFVKELLNVDDLPVIYYDDSLKKDVLFDCTESRYIGATYMRLEDGKNVLFCLTTEDKIYVIDMKHTSHVEFLKELLLRKDLRLYITGGQYVSYKMHTEFDIQLRSILDLHTADIFIRMRKNMLKIISSSQKYAMKSYFNDITLLGYRNRVELQDHWLKVTLPKIDREREKKETNAILTDQHSVEAKNVIRLRSYATRELALAMENEISSMKHQDSNNIYRFALQIENDAYTDYENLACNKYSTVMRYLNNSAPLKR